MLDDVTKRIVMMKTCPCNVPNDIGIAIAFWASRICSEIRRRCWNVAVSLGQIPRDVGDHGYIWLLRLPPQEQTLPQSLVTSRLSRACLFVFCSFFLLINVDTATPADLVEAAM